MTASAEFIVLLPRRRAVEAGKPVMGSVFLVICQSPEEFSARRNDEKARAGAGTENGGPKTRDSPTHDAHPHAGSLQLMRDTRNVAHNELRGAAVLREKGTCQ